MARAPVGPGCCPDRDWGQVESLLEEAAAERGPEIVSEDEARADGHARKREGTFYPEAVSGVWQSRGTGKAAQEATENQ